MSQTKTFRCDCGNNTGHTDEATCMANRQATNVYMSRREAVIPNVRTEAGVFVRFCVGDEYDMPHGTVLADGVIRRW